MSCLYILYAPKYHTDPDNALALSTCGSVKEARKEKEELFPDAVIVEAWIKKIDGVNTLCDETIVE